MADQDVIKEFLVSLGFKQDEKSLKTFTGGIDNATRAVTRLVTTIAGASLTVAAGVSAFASNLEGLYFASQRIGSSADSLKAADYAARDLGASANEVRGSLEGMARFLRENPGGESFLKGIGVQTRDANGNLKDTADLMVGLGQKLRNMPWYQAKQYASILGVDDNTLRAIMSGEFARKLEENRKRFSGSGLDKATKDAHAFMESLRQVGMQFETFSIRVQAALMHQLGPDLERFAEWFELNGPKIADRVAEIVVKLVEMAEKAGPYLTQIWQFFVDLDTATDGWSTKLIALLWVLKAIGATSVIAGISKLASAFFRLAGGMGAVAAASLTLSGDTSESSKEAQKLQDKARLGDRAAAEELAKKQLDNQWWRKWFGGVTKEDVRIRTDEIMAGVHSGDPAGYNAAGMTGSDMATFVADFFEGKGWTGNQAAGISANLQAESQFNPRAIGDKGKARGVAQWHPHRQADFKEWAGFDISDDRADLIKQLEFVHFELTEGSMRRAGALLKAAQNANEAGGVVSRYYEIPKLVEYEAAMRGRQAAQIAQTTNINVYGATDPNSTAAAVSGAQKQVTQDMARNLSNPVN
ncbi:phage tail tip lysozyme [Pseudomonas sp. GD03860]|uniref:phage tail tip lysozyme n=1 Tax=Pseudomonas sp. GD03860 TaxID=2975389 RepID=UPI00244C4D32|nr:phage tail tip lysozyme [Pseudomonas sp. GD03860]MDH0638193.1 phage tail tip lysozyme [Pseudomonas sp. GD03860]